MKYIVNITRTYEYNDWVIVEADDPDTAKQLGVRETDECRLDPDQLEMIDEDIEVKPYDSNTK